MKIPLAELIKYPLPAFLNGRCEPKVYYKWLLVKAITLLRRDKKRKKPYTANATISTYKEKIHSAVTESCEYDPYTGEYLAWELIGQWDSSHDQSDDYKKEFALLPTVDHVNATELKFQICSWKINDAKSSLTTEEFLNLCEMVTNYRKK
jgi:hypothetical protein